MTVATLIVVGFSVIVQADPYLQLLLWTNGVGIIGIVALQCLCGVAIVRFFSNDRRGYSAQRVLVAPALASLGLIAAILLMVSNFEVLTGVGSSFNAVLLSPLMLAFVFGALRPAV